jgi:hypothetical protein
MTDTTWLLIATTETKSFVAQTIVNDPKLVYRALCKWLIRGGASKLLDSFWEYLDKYDNELEDALLDQLLTQAETAVDDPQITNVRTKDYSIDMTVHAKNSSDSLKTCKVECTLYVYFQSLKKKLRIDEQSIKLTMIRSDGKLERISVNTSTKTPAATQHTESRRVRKRSSKVSV